VRLDAVSSVLLELLHQLGGFCKGLLGGCQLLAIGVGILLPVQPGFCHSQTRFVMQQQQQQQQQQQGKKWSEKGKTERPARLKTEKARLVRMQGKAGK